MYVLADLPHDGIRLCPSRMRPSNVGQLPYDGANGAKPVPMDLAWAYLKPASQRTHFTLFYLLSSEDKFGKKKFIHHSAKPKNLNQFLKEFSLKWKKVDRKFLEYYKLHTQQLLGLTLSRQAVSLVNNIYVACQRKTQRGPFLSIFLIYFSNGKPEKLVATTNESRSPEKNCVED